MLQFSLHFLMGLIGGGVIFAIFFRLSGADSTSAPFGLVLLAVACGSLAVYVSPWATPAVLVAYVVVSLKEHIDERREGRSHPPPGTGGL